MIEEIRRIKPRARADVEVRLQRVNQGSTLVVRHSGGEPLPLTAVGYFAFLQMDGETRLSEIQERIELARLQTQYRISGNTTGVRAAIDSEKIRTERDKAAAATNTKLTEAQLKNQNLALGYDTFG